MNWLKVKWDKDNKQFHDLSTNRKVKLNKHIKNVHWFNPVELILNKKIKSSNFEEIAFSQWIRQEELFNRDVVLQERWWLHRYSWKTVTYHADEMECILNFCGLEDHVYSRLIVCFSYSSRFFSSAHCLRFPVCFDSFKK